MATTNNIISFTLPNMRYVIDTVTGRGTYLTGFPEGDFRTGIIGNSDCNMFIPAIAVMNHELLEFENGQKVLEYSMPVVSTRYGAFRQYNTLLDNLFRGNQPGQFTFKVAGVQHSVYMHRGLLYDREGKILMCVGIETNYALTIPVNQPGWQQYFDATKFVLFMTPEFDRAEFKNLKKKLEATYINNCRTAGMDVIYTTRIEQWLFKNNFVPPVFKNVMQMNKHLKEEVPKNLLMT